MRDVHYRLHARFELTPRAGASDTPTKFAEMFRRRALAGQCVNQPYLGCREFAANVRLVTDSAGEPVPCAAAHDDLGWMLYDLDYCNPDSPAPLFFRACLDHGVMQVPRRDSAEVRG